MAQFAAEGLARRDIARRLFISENTVKTHLEHVYQKLGVRNRAQLARILRERSENHPFG